MKRPYSPFAAYFFQAFPARRGARIPTVRPGYTLVELPVTTIKIGRAHV